MHGGTDVIDTTLGPVRGDHKRGILRCKGIPFAAPPIGERRFRPPAPAEPWSDVFDAVGRFPIAPQPLAGMEAAAGAEGTAEQSEAGCLTLNVWTPAADDARRPVLFWIHGGGFMTGAGTIPWYDGTNLAKRDVVVVSCNYRLGALGFLHLEEVGGSAYAGSGNVGLLDQVAALRWVQDNIEAFGGDPGNVTIFGESAGGMSVATLLGTPAARGLFHKAIPQSGAAANINTTDRATAVARKLLDRLGIDDVDQLLDVAADDLIGAQATGNSFGRSGGLPFQPVVDGTVLDRPPMDAVAAGAAAGVPVLAGSNAHEMRLFMALDSRLADTDRAANLEILERHAPGRAEELHDVYQRIVGDDPADVLQAAMTDRVFRLPAIALLAAQSEHAAVFSYEFRFESTAFGGTLGSAHAVEIPFVFDNLDAPGAAFFTGEPTDSMRTLATAMADAWVAFARTGAPTSDGLPDWPAYDTAGRATMVLHEAPQIECDPGREQRQLWAGAVNA